MADAVKHTDHISTEESDSDCNSDAETATKVNIHRSMSSREVNQDDSNLSECSSPTRKTGKAKSGLSPFIQQSSLGDGDLLKATGPENQAGFYSMFKGIMQEMSSNLVSVIQNTFKSMGSVSPSEQVSKFQSGELTGKQTPSQKSYTERKKGHKTHCRSDLRKTKRRTLTQKSDSSSEESDDSQEVSSLSSDDSNSVATSQIFRRKKSFKAKNVKLPIFDGKEKWQVWYNRFEAVANLNNWTDSDRLRELLPRLQGDAGEFVFDQLPSKTLSNYRKIIKELKNRFGTNESTKTFVVKFNRRNQGNSETVEDYSAELKRLYSKAYPLREGLTRQEDLIQRFLMGLRDDKARQHVELNKNPSTIEEAVHLVVRYIETTRYINASGEYEEKMFRKATRQVQNESSKPRKDNSFYPRNQKKGESNKNTEKKEERGSDETI